MSLRNNSEQLTKSADLTSSNQGLCNYQKHTYQNCTHQKGFSLIEVMVSLVLVSIGLMAMASLQSRSVNNSTVAYTETQSTLHLKEIVELLRANKVAAASGDYNIVLSSFSDLSSGGTTIAETDRYNWFNNLDNVLPNAKASINCDVDSRCVLELQYDFTGTTQTQSLAVIL